MLTYCLKCKRNTNNTDAKMIKTKNGRKWLKFAVCGAVIIKIYERTRTKKIVI